MFIKVIIGSKDERDVDVTFLYELHNLSILLLDGLFELPELDF